MFAVDPRLITHGAMLLESKIDQLQPILCYEKTRQSSIRHMEANPESEWVLIPVLPQRIGRFASCNEAEPYKIVCAVWHYPTANELLEHSVSLCSSSLLSDDYSVCDRSRSQCWRKLQTLCSTVRKTLIHDSCICVNLTNIALLRYFVLWKTMR